MNTIKRKIIIIGPTESILTKRGNRHPALAQFLVNKGYELQYLTSDFYHAEKRWFSKEEIDNAQKAVSYNLVVFKCLGYNSNISPKRVFSNILLSLKIFLFLLTRVNKTNVVILPSRPVEMIFFAALLRLIKKTSVLLDIQDVWPDMLPPTSAVKKIAFYSYCNALLYPSLRFIDKFIHTAPSFNKWLRRYAPRRKSVFVPLGYDKNRWNNWFCIRTVEPIEQPIKMVCVAKLQHQIDCAPIVEALKDNPKFSFWIIGEDGTGDRYSEIRKIMEKYNINNVSITGKVPPDEIPAMLHGMHIGVVPMISPSIPNKVFDYIGSGLPILVLGDFDSSTFVLENNIGWTCDYNAESVRKLLVGLTADEIKKKSENVSKIKELYSRDELFQKVEKLLRLQQ